MKYLNSMKKGLTSMLAFQSQNPLGIDIYKKYIHYTDRFLYHGKVDDTHLEYLKTPHIINNIDQVNQQPINYYDCVINHLAIPPRESVKDYIQSLYKIAKPNGLIILSLPNKYPYLGALHWYTKLLPDATLEYASTIPSQDELYTWLGDNAFKVIDIIKPKDELMLKGEVYYNPSGIYDPCWQQSDRFWEYVSQEELARIERIVPTLFKHMKIYEYIKEVDEYRKKYGQIYFIVARKTPYREFY